MKFLILVVLAHLLEMSILVGYLIKSYCCHNCKQSRFFLKKELNATKMSFTIKENL